MDPSKPGRWRKGESGNPSGRKPGSGKVAALREAIHEHVPEIVARLVAAAKDGDVAAARLLLERAVPPLKAEETPVVLEQPTGTLTDQGRGILAAVAAGALAPGQGAALVASLGTLAKLAEVDELSARVAKLEERHGNKH